MFEKTGAAAMQSANENQLLDTGILVVFDPWRPLN